MKRASHVFEKIYDVKNLEQAFYRAAKGKRTTKDVLLFEQNLDANLIKLASQIKNNT